MNKEINTIIANLEGCIGMFDYLLTPTESNLLVAYIEELQQENKQLKDKLSKIETLIINHNCDTGDIYYKYNNRFLKSELKQRILEILYEQGSDSNDSN